MVRQHGSVLAALLLQESAALLQMRGAEVLQPVHSLLGGSKHEICNQKSVNKNPGAGIDHPAPFQSVFKDGYLAVGCFRDELLYVGDKYGPNKHDYQLGEVANISIVRYEGNVAKEDQRPMSMDVCFDFCRTLPEMSSFGIVHGRDCYCAPYFKQMAGDDSMCDNVCEGNSVQMCGGKTKSSIFQMHSCNDGAADLETAANAATAGRDLLAMEIGKLEPLVASMQAIAAAFQETLGKAGDVAASNLMQQAKIVAGELNESLVKGQSVEGAVTAKLAEGDAAQPGSANHAAVEAAETIEQELVKLSSEANDNAEHLMELLHDVSPDVSEDELAPTFYKIMYFVDKKFEKAPTTCSGTLLGRPLVNKTSEECGRICDRRGQECKGYSYFPEGLCFLMKKFKTVRYYTECEDDPAKMQDFNGTSCNVRFSDYQGTNISPTSKTCKECLAELDAASGCRLG